MRLTIALLVALVFSVPTDSSAQFRALADFTTERNQIRRDKFDVVLPEVMREQGIDM